MYLLSQNKDEFTLNTADKLSNYILIENEKLSDYDFGGFYWWVHQVASAVKIGNHNNKKVLVYFTQGFYKDNNRYEPSWWSYYYKYPTLTPYEITLIKYAKNNGKLHVVKSYELPELEDDKMFLYTVGDSFTNLMRNLMTDTHLIYNTFLELNDNVIEVFNQFCNLHSIDFDNQLFVGLHYRGTDKWYAHNDTEDLDKNKHMCYSEVVSKTRKQLESIKLDNIDKTIHMYVCSDEQPFVDYISNHFDRVYSYHAFRSPISTSNIELPEDTSLSPSDDSEYGKLLKYYASQSIHKGFEHISPYKKGLDAVIDVYCLSKCKYFLFCQKGNFASQPSKLNKDIIEFDLSNI